MDFEAYMREAITLAEAALDAGEVPVGCVIADAAGVIVSRGQNTRERSRSALGHAELFAIDEACRARGDWRLDDCTLFVTLEPCPMCTGAIINARIPRVVYGAADAKFGACRSVCSLFDMPFNHRPQVEAGVMEREAADLMRDFFQNLRVQLRTRPRWRRPAPPG